MNTISTMSEKDLEKALKKFGQKRSGIAGKSIGGSLYVHKDYENLIPNIEKAKEALSPEFEYNIVKNVGNGNISFLHSPDWDSADEPIIDESWMVSSSGQVKQTTKPGSKDPMIYHHKWEFVGKDYKGFDVLESMRRSLIWLSLPNRPSSSEIGKKSVWDSQVVPRIEEHKQLLEKIGMNPSQEELSALKVQPEATQRDTNILGKIIKHIPQNFLENGKVKNGISIGAGKGLEARKYGFKTHEPFPEGWSPDFSKIDASDVPSNTFDVVVNTYVLNVVAKDTRDQIVQTIGRVMKSGGIGIIVTRGNDIKEDNAIIKLGPLEIITKSGGKLTYQKGFTQQELSNYVKHVLGNDFSVETLPGGSASSVWIKIVKGTVNEAFRKKLEKVFI